MFFIKWRSIMFWKFILLDMDSYVVGLVQNSTVNIITSKAPTHVQLHTYS